MKVLFKYILPIVALIFISFHFFVRNLRATPEELAPDFDTELIDRTPFKLSELKGGYVLLDFWASRCGLCRRAIQI
ncbi:MAG: redoxin domain-containing protein [Flavobacteriales bacterium]|nr:redoxin domain-containing protein [Flavobacteriales bacterium]